MKRNESMGITSLLSNNGYILYNKQIAKSIGINEAVLLGELCSEYEYWEVNDKLEDGWFFSTIENIEEATSLSAHQQRSAIQTLVNVGYIEVQQRGIPCKRYFRLNQSQMLKNLTTSCEETEQQDVKKVNGNINNTINKKTNKKEVFKKPTLEEVKAYIKEKGYVVNAETFYDYFEEGDWIDSEGKPVRSWKQKIITWDKKEKARGPTKKKRPTYETDESDEYLPL